MEVAGTLISSLLRRVRDPQGLANTRGFTRSILSDCQRLINARSRRVLETIAGFVTEPMRMFYPLTASMPTAVRVQAVREGDRDLDRVTLKQLSQINSTWFRRTGDRFEAFAEVGRDLIVIYPAKTITSTVDIVAVKLTDNLIDENEATDLPDEDLLDVMELAEAVLLAKMREIDTVKPLIERIVKRTKDRLAGVEV